MKVLVRATSASRENAHQCRVTFEGLVPDAAPVVGNNFEIEIPDPPKTPGQLAFEAFWAEPPASPFNKWANASTDQRRAWEAAAKAARGAP